LPYKKFRTNFPRFNQNHAYVKLANESAPAHSHIYEEMIYYLAINSERKLPITAKGNLQRNKCAKMFDEEVRQLVAMMECGHLSDN
jgi:hypothetical protein